MRVEWTDEFDLWLTRLEARAAAGTEVAIRQLDFLAAELKFLQDLDESPTRETETAQLRWVRQRRKHELWRVSHRFDPDVAMRVIVWFPPSRDTVVLTVFAGDKKQIGDAFYNSVASRADAAIDRWINQTRKDDDG